MRVCRRSARTRPATAITSTGPSPAHSFPLNEKSAHESCSKPSQPSRASRCTRRGVAPRLAAGGRGRTGWWRGRRGSRVRREIAEPPPPPPRRPRPAARAGRRPGYFALAARPAATPAHSSLPVTASASETVISAVIGTSVTAVCEYATPIVSTATTADGDEAGGRPVGGAAQPPRGRDAADAEGRDHEAGGQVRRARPATPGRARGRREAARGSRTSAGRGPPPWTIFHARGTMFCSSGSSRLPNGRPYSIPISRSDRRERQDRGEERKRPSDANPHHSAPAQRARRRGRALGFAQVLDGRRRAADEVGDLGRADEHGVDPGPFEREHLLARGGREVGDRELAGRHIGQQVEDSLDMGLVVVGLPRREQEDLRVDPLERVGERLLVVDVDDDLEPELGRAARGAPRGAPRRRGPRRRSGTRRRRRRCAASGEASTRKRIGRPVASRTPSAGAVDGEPFGALLLGRSRRVRRRRRAR